MYYNDDEIDGPSPFTARLGNSMTASGTSPYFSSATGLVSFAGGQLLTNSQGQTTLSSAELGESAFHGLANCNSSVVEVNPWTTAVSSISELPTIGNDCGVIRSPNMSAVAVPNHAGHVGFESVLASGYKRSSTQFFTPSAQAGVKAIPPSATVIPSSYQVSTYDPLRLSNQPGALIKPSDVVLNSWVEEITPGSASCSVQTATGARSITSSVLSGTGLIINSIVGTNLFSAYGADSFLVPNYLSNGLSTTFGYDHAYYRKVDIVGGYRVYRKTTLRFIWIRRLALNLRELGRHFATFLEESGASKNHSRTSKKSHVSNPRPTINLPLVC